MGSPVSIVLPVTGLARVDADFFRSRHVGLRWWQNSFADWPEDKIFYPDCMRFYAAIVFHKSSFLIGVAVYFVRVGEPSTRDFNTVGMNSNFSAYRQDDMANGDRVSRLG